MEVRTTIRSKLLRHSLLRGTFLAGAGALLLLISGTLMPIALLKVWGFPIVITGFLLIGLGLVPYRRLTHLQLHPNKLVCSATEWLYMHKGQPLLRIPVADIEALSYLEGSRYGLSLTLRNTKSLFLPYFSERTCEELKSLIESDRAS